MNRARDTTEHAIGLIVSAHSVYRVDKADPHGFCHEVPPRTASVVAELWYNWGKQTWMAERAKRNALAAPMAIYEIHLGSWRRVPEEGDRPLSYWELAPRLAGYVQRLGFTHVECLPVMEHPYLRLLGLREHGLLCANQSLRHTAALYEGDCDPAGFARVDCNDAESSVVSWLRQGLSSQQSVLNVRHGKPDLTLRVDIFEQARTSYLSRPVPHK